MTENRYKDGMRVTWVGIAINVALTAVKAVAGVVAGSTAMVADAFHSASDIAGSVVVLGGLSLASKPPDVGHHYGHAKLESVVAKLIALLLIVTGGGIAWAAWGVLRSGAIAPPGIAALAAAVFSIVIKEGMYRYTLRVGKAINSTAVVADAWHHRTDALSSVAALIGIGGARLGYPILDPLAGLVVGGLIVKSGLEIYVGAIRELIDTAPDPKLVRDIGDAALEVKGVHSVQEVRARYNGPYILVDLKFCVDPHVTVEEGHRIGKQAKERIIEKVENIQDVLVHVNPCDPWERDQEVETFRCKYCENEQGGNK